MQTTDVRVDFHRDRDEHLALRTGREIHPRWSSVLFLNRCRGGLLAVTRASPNPQRPSHAPDRLELDLVNPAPNRFAFFSGDLTHGVLDANNRIPEAPLRGSVPWRLAVVFNWWHRAPEVVRPWSQRRIYRSLGVDVPRGATGP
jgi:hypothetical protein